MDEQKKGTRRRGEVLDEAITLAAWEELQQIGYTKMTMESVATRAGTNKSVLYRRWPHKSKLVMAALRKYYLPKITNEIPDTGNLRDDVFEYLHARVEPLKIIGAETMRGLISEPEVWRNLAASMPQVAERKSESKLMAEMTVMLKNAEKRGEINLDKLTLRIISLPLDLLQHELISRLEPISDETIAQIVDEIFIPLVYMKSDIIK